MRGVGGAITRASGIAEIDMYLRDDSDSTIHLTTLAHVLSDLRPNMLVGTDVLKRYGVTLDFDKDRLLFPLGRSVLMSSTLSSNPGTQSHQQTALIPLRAAYRTVLWPNQFTPVQVRSYQAPATASALFTSLKEGFFTQIIDSGATFIYARHDRPHPIEVHEGVPVGTLSTMCWDDIQAIDHRNWHLAGHQATELEMQAWYASALQSNHAEPTGEHELRIKGHFGTTIYGKDDVATAINGVLEDFQPLFTDDGKIARLPENEWMSIPLVNDWNTADAKLAHKVYPMGPKDREFIDQTHDKLHTQGRMQWSAEPTPFGFPVFVVWRTVNGERKGRVVVDIRGLNKVAMTDAYPMPLQTDITALAKNKNYLSVVDGTNFFHQFSVKPEDRHKLTVVSHRGQEQYKVAVMGFKNTPPYAQRQIDRILREAGCQLFAKAYIDDILIFSETLEDHVQHLRAVFGALQAKNLTLSGKKAFLGFPSIQLLGQHVDGFGLTTSADKIAAIKNLSFPSTLKDLEMYLGMTGWLRHYIEYYAQLAEPLQARKTSALKGAPPGGHSRQHFTSTARIDPTPELLDAFESMQKAFADPKMLVHFDHKRPLYILLDASKKRGYGVCVAHVKGDPISGVPVRTKLEPVLFLSKTLSSAERRYWPTELEVACLVWTVKRVRWMIEACEQPVNVLTDHAATTGIAQQTALNSTSIDKLNQRLIRASQYLSQFRNLKVTYIPGREHVVPDALSRLVARESSTVHDDDDVLDDLVMANWLEATCSQANATSVLEIKPEFKAQLSQAYDKDKFFSNAKQHAIAQPDSGPFSWYDDLLWMKGRLCVPKELIGDIFRTMHDEQFHVGLHRLYPRVREQYYIRKLDKRLRTYLAHCNDCQRLQTKRHRPFGSLQPIYTPATPFHTITIDFILGLPYNNNLNTIMSCTDKFSKRVILVPGHDKYTASAWAHNLLDELLKCDWGLPSAIISDRDPKFLSDMWKAIFQRMGVTLLHSTAYHPQTDGQSERTNQTVEIALRYYLARYPDGAMEWQHVLPQLTFTLNNSVNASTNASPNEICYGFKPREAADVDPPGEQNRTVVRAEAEDSLTYAQTMMKANFDAKHKHWTPEPGEMVYLNLEHYRIAGQANRKLTEKRAGPFLVERLVGKLACKLSLPGHFKIHPVISVTQLEPVPQSQDPYQRVLRTREQIPIPQMEEPTPQMLLKARTRAVGRSQTVVTEYLVRYHGAGSDQDKWIREENLPTAMVRKYKRQTTTGT